MMISVILNALMLNVIMLNVVMLSVFMLSIREPLLKGKAQYSEILIKIGCFGKEKKIFFQ